MAVDDPWSICFRRRHWRRHRQNKSSRLSHVGTKRWLHAIRPRYASPPRLTNKIPCSTGHREEPGERWGIPRRCGGSHELGRGRNGKLQVSRGQAGASGLIVKSRAPLNEFGPSADDTLPCKAVRSRTSARPAASFSDITKCWPQKSIPSRNATVSDAGTAPARDEAAFDAAPIPEELKGGVK